jgi:hypothetical protein
MVLPFLKKKYEAGMGGVIVKTREPDKTQENQEVNEEDAAIEAVASDLIEAIHSKDVKRAAEAIRAAFEIMDSLPHEEGPHTNEE